ncbi:MAG TPA: histidine phosphatase family protein [candidate division Zixibacteria bacterium]|nr:histidine phosphatase family protein [candidate division Zixibacteria bacterium]
MHASSLGTLDVLLVRHAAPVLPGTEGWEERDPERPLTEEGERQAEELADELEPYSISAIYSSPYRRAVQTVEPVARRRGMEVQLITDLRERLLTTVPRDDWQDQLARAWADPDYALAGAESGREAQLRGIGVLDLLRVRHPDGGTLLVGSHGNLISLILHRFEPEVDVRFHLAMPMPAIYHLQHDGIGWRVMGGHGFVQAAPRN